MTDGHGRMSESGSARRHAQTAHIKPRCRRSCTKAAYKAVTRQALAAWPPTSKAQFHLSRTMAAHNSAGVGLRRVRSTPPALRQPASWSSARSTSLPQEGSPQLVRRQPGPPSPVLKSSSFHCSIALASRRSYSSCTMAPIGPEDSPPMTTDAVIASMPTSL
eukprot:2118377-Prymnesium_polylepis.1